MAGFQDVSDLPYNRDAPDQWDGSYGRRDDDQLGDDTGAQEDQREDAPGYYGDEDPDAYAMDESSDADNNDNRDQDDDLRNDDTGAPLPQRRTPAPRPPTTRSRFKGSIRKGLRAGVKYNPVVLQAKFAKKVFSKLWGVDDSPSHGAVCGEDPTPENPGITFDIYKTGFGWSGVIRVPVGADKAILMHTSPAPTRGKAAAKSANMLKALDHPLLKSVMPPQARLAVTALKSAPAAKAAKILSRFAR